jgi:hypothetical protein
LEPVYLKSKANGLFGRVILDSAVEPLFVACLACNKILHFQSSHNGSVNLRRHLRSCPASRKRSSGIREAELQRSGPTSLKRKRKKIKSTMIDEWLNKNSPSEAKNLLRVYSPTSSDSSDTSD